MIVWTMQPASALDQIRKTGVFRCSPELSYNLSKADSLKPAYAWLMERMREKIGTEPAGVVSPVWAWHTWNFERKSPDPESAAFLRRSEEKVLLTLDIPENEAVLTDFDAWQGVMMNTYVSNASSESEYYALETLLDSLSGDALHDAIRESWTNVFLTDRMETEYLIRGRYVQATFWEIKDSYIREKKLLSPNI